MRAPAATPGMGSLLTEEGCRFRVWAPNKKRLQVIGEFSSTPIDLARTLALIQWSVDPVFTAKPNDRYEHVITNWGGRQR